MTQSAPLLLAADYRKFMRQKRRLLDAATRQHCASLASRFLPKLFSVLPNNANIAFYLDSFGEMPTEPLAKFCQRYGYQGFLPITRHGEPLRFAPIYQPLAKTPLRRHHLGMAEPTTHKIDARRMHAIICPAVAIDKTGLRLGMGGGYYDRTFAHAPNCLKIAWCYDFQLVDSLPRQAWDKSMDIIITERRFIRIN
ncbi:5-formyltetrahydrofolate cyclo-ligase [Moraxella cuniculi DSM 21768]|uniref:5-formyltetrahydrofolate cyclo-ligase n=1 Tax=Moraxella cuniculi DSM 21768 TaxID=1122245 RepID=A0A1N7FLZ7_9GAMM|nr:5-formyltetrahydrofolate cyclo-ligase [Moraxella cuniculi]OOS05720.1 5-formyltetrahydrofolate cyclo-ligase [Moraxella cuniculi]SIS01295.1 5-formyltetrahydrofolate cyclo-ligase [Moraxella cuniculi DSM 21768]